MDGLQLTDVSVRFGETVAVDDVSLVLSRGQVLAVLGPSGCGKSTLLRVIAGLQRADSGRVLFDGDDVTENPTHRRGFALMFQDGQLFGHQSVAGNVAYPLRRQGISRRDAAARVAELLELVGLGGLGERRPATLSGGQQQRVALARALAASPRLLLLDEPLSALDRNLRDRLGSDLRQILAESRTTALLVTHDHDEAFTLADRMAVMRAGRIVQDGPTVEVWRSPADAEVAEFLGCTSVLTGSVAQRLTGQEEVALRPQALRLDPAGELEATVTRAGQGADVVRLGVDVDGIGEAVAIADPGTDLPELGARVRLRLDLAGTAVLQA